MKYKFPAKTFLLGEYVALFGGPALLVTTTPCFEMDVTSEGESFVHPDSPAGKFLKNKPFQLSQWLDPYKGIGGLGASSAQFLGAYVGTHNLPLTKDALLEAYWQVSKLNNGMRPSGYDVLAQASQGLVYLHHEEKAYKSYEWSFDDISFLLLHTGNKLATHEHLSQIKLDEKHLMAQLAPIVELGKAAFENVQSPQFIEAINHYFNALKTLDLVTKNTATAVETLLSNPDILAAKGCGAMGADVLLLVVPSEKLADLEAAFTHDGHKVLASSQTIYFPEKSEPVLFSS